MAPLKLKRRRQRESARSDEGRHQLLHLGTVLGTKIPKESGLDDDLNQSFGDSAPSQAQWNWEPEMSNLSLKADKENGANQVLAERRVYNDVNQSRSMEGEPG